VARRFEFRLEAVRTVRRRTRDAHQRAVAEAARAVAEAKQRIALLDRYLESAFDESRRLQTAGRLDMAAMRSNQLHRGWVERAVDRTVADLSHRQAGLAATRGDLAEAAKALKAIDKLHDRQWARYRTEVGKEEQHATDEAAAQMALRSAQDNPPWGTMS
jgi:flagellar export protein FliJ